MPGAPSAKPPAPSSTLLPERLSYPVEHSMIVYAGRPLSEAARAFIDDLLQVHGLGS